MPEHKPEVGQRLFLVQRNRRTSAVVEVEVMKVGTKYFYVAEDVYKDAPHCWTKASLCDWRDRFSGFYLTRQEYEDSVKAVEKLGELRRYFSSITQSKLSLDQIKRIEAIIHET